MSVLGSEAYARDRTAYATLGPDDLSFYFTPNDVTIQVRSVSNIPLTAARLDKLRLRCGFSRVDVLRNRRRAFLVIASPFDSFGPSQLDFYPENNGPTRDFDPLSPTFDPPNADTRRWLNQARQ